MKLLATLLCILFAISFVESGLGDGVSEDEEEDYEVLYQKAQDCLLQNGYGQLDGNETLEQFRVKLRDVCGKRTALGQCLDTVTSDVSRLNETYQTEFRLFRTYKELSLEVGCGENEGEGLARIIEAFKRTENNFLQGCRKNATRQTVRPNSGDPNRDMMYEYKVLQSIKECVDEHKGQDDHLVADLMISMCVQIMDRMKCVQGETDVLCKTIVDSH